MQYKMNNKNNLASMTAFLCLLAVPFILSCGNGGDTENTKEEYPADSFEAFYKQFHEDSVFQLAHITFPLEGLPGMADSFLINHGQYFYEKKGWKTLHAMDWDTTTMFQRKLEDTGLGAINEYICTYDKFCMSRRFAKLSDGWYLIYYEDMNYRPDLF